MDPELDQSVGGGEISEPPAGLSPEHQTELNGFGTVPDEVRRERYAALRQEYSDNALALEQIDVFDSTSPYGVARREYRIAILNGDNLRQTELDLWFKDNYPLTEAQET